MTDELDFGEPLTAPGIERAELLNQAASALDRLGGQLGPGGKRVPSKEGDLARAFADDLAEAQRPQVFRLDADRLDPERHAVPVDIEELLRRSKFYWLSLPVSLWSRPGWGFNRLEAKAEFAVDGDVATFDLLPDQEFATRFQANAEIDVGVDASMKFSATVPTVAVGLPGGAGGAVGASADANAALKTGFVVGPFGYRVTAPKVKHSPPGLDHAFWRLDGAQYVDERDPGLRVILRVPKDAITLEVTMAIQARRYFNMLSARLQEAVTGLPAGIANFFKGGTPIGDSQTWDLSGEM
jgi:hypothetical protein